jgi:hypothetical protein
MAERSIFGESFKPYVSNQIKIRQQKLAKSNKYDQDTITFINNSTSWLRLASGVDVSSARTKEIGVNLPGNKLANQYVLSSAYFNQKVSLPSPSLYSSTTLPAFTSGVGYDSSATSYGFLSSPTYGLVPPPGIISAEIRPAGDKSTLRYATVQIECHNLSQFKVIEALYLRLKYSMLLEWGHTVWFDNKGTLNKSVPNNVLNKFLNGGYDQDSLLTDLEKTRSDFSGNYDGFYGWVRNFTWDLKPNGGYDVILELVAIGDVIESLKLNTNYPQPSSQTSTSVTSDEEEKPEFPNKEKSTIHQILHAIRSELNKGDGFLDGTQLSSENIIELTKKHSSYDLIGVNYKHPDEKSDTLNHILTYQEGGKQRYAGLTTLNDNTTGYFYFIKLGTLLRIIESFLLKYDTSKGTAGTYKPLFKIDHDYNNNLCLTLPRQISIDPRICLLKPSDKAMSTEGDSSQAVATTTYQKLSFPAIDNNSKFGDVSWSNINNEDSNFSETSIADSYTKMNDSNGNLVKIQVNYKSGQTVIYDVSSGNTPEFYINTSTYNTNNEVTSTNENGVEETTQNAFNLSTLGDYFRVGSGYEFLGRFMHIHVNIDYISTLLADNIDENGKVTLIKFLQQLMQGIQSATGNLNNFEIKYDELINTMYIIDTSVLPNADKLLGRDLTPTRINTHLLTDSLGSFVTNVSLKSNLNNNYSSQITAAAQSNSNVVGETATAFSKWNIGYTDRIIPERSSIMDKQTQKSGSLSSNPETVYLENLIKYASLANFIQTGLITSEDITAYGSAIVDMLKYEINYFTEKDCLPGPGFLPINLQIVMSGLSGPRVFESYTINETLLPSNYKNNIKFLTKSVTHKIDINGWTTTLDSFTAPDVASLKKPDFWYPLEEDLMKRSKNGATEENFNNTKTKNSKVYVTNTVSGQAYGDTRRDGRRHAGVDFDISGADAEMISFIGGKVIKVGNDPGGYYQYLDIYNAQLGVVERIAEAANIMVSLNQTIAKGQVVTIGESSTGVIHYEIRYKKDYDRNAFGFETSTNPLEFLSSRGIVGLDPSPLSSVKTEVIFNNTPTETTPAAPTTSNTPSFISEEETNRRIAAEKGYPPMLTDATIAKLKAAGWPNVNTPQYQSALIN